MKKILVSLFVIVISLSFFGCGEIEYTLSQNFDYSVTQKYKIYLDEEYLAQYKYTAEDMKIFLFKFFGLYSGKAFTQTQLKRNSLSFGDEEQGFKCYLNFDQENSIITFDQTFEDQQAYYDFYGISDDEQDKPYYQVEKGFFYYRLIQKMQSPLLVVKEKWHELYVYDGELYPEADAQGKLDFAQIFMLGLKDSQGNTVFAGFRETFPDIPKDDADQILYRFVLSYSRGRLENTAHKTERDEYYTYLIWEHDNDTIGEEITLVVLKPNSVGWNVLALGLTAVFAGIMVVVALISKKHRPKIEPIIPPPPKAPPSVFGDEYK